tara:strand:- start:72 stop:500 length:429 start_codon:yes stop_codon:yes gene_type:complete
MKKFFFYIIIVAILIPYQLFANKKNEYFQEGVSLFISKNFDKAKFKFEQDLILNPKNEMSYLYLSKIFHKLNKKNLQEVNLNTVILLDPINEEATYILAKLKLENSDYKKSKELNDKLYSFCNKLCEKSKKLKVEIEKLSKK